MEANALRDVRRTYGRIGLVGRAKSDIASIAVQIAAKDIVMITCSEVISRFISVLSISPAAEDHATLQDMLQHREQIVAGHQTLTMHFCSTLAAALAALKECEFDVVICERDLRPGSWKEVLEETAILSDPPLVIVTSELADDRLWAEALNLGAFDVLAKPFDRTETTKVFDAACRSVGRPPRASPALEVYAVRAAGVRR